MTRDRCVNNGGQALPAEVVDDAQHPEPAAPGKAVGHEVERPALVGSLRDRHGCADPKRPLSPATLAHSQPLFPVDAVSVSGAFAAPQGPRSPSTPVHLPAPPAQARCAGGDSQTGGVPTTTRAPGFVAGVVRTAWIDSDGLAGRCLPVGRHDAANSPSRSWPRTRRISLPRASEFFPSISRNVATSITDSAKSFFSFAFSSSSCFSRLASLTSMPPNFERQL